jgi:hypothetical protein
MLTPLKHMHYRAFENSEVRIADGLIVLRTFVMSDLQQTS